ncbi:MAG: dienelactone hydrolase family protein [Rhodospirillales bacterium]|jgi:carboxymethylenebutenolidase|nr:dienelactone hydrolase family protein [Rhodospirillales bacterium]MBT5076931.1 dienelactone hydrolase family protein [Rhodospirillales bacterium]MBT5113454.1 dienelactone hydrolase family protein [Rhodospirillales bacterium]MBT5673752.1 dienelactone hydrolase family protein [Rhodospirillales bacterium]MBT6186410.1 dienelactone hydrolase family protein [Rhodospirillales bacterium]
MHDMEILEVGGSPMETLVFSPKGVGPFPGVIVMQHLPVAHGGLETDPFTLDVGERLAKAGYVAIIPFMFHWWPKAEEKELKRDEFRDDRAAADLQVAYQFTANMDNVDATKIGIMGHCWGGRLSWLGACHNPDYKACAVLYGGRIKTGLGDGSVSLITLADQIPCPVLGIFGNDDKNPSPDDVDDLDKALDAVGVEHVFHQYDGAGHGFQDFVNTDRYRQVQSDDAWEKLLAFFDAKLK